jgi:hypothetical protein
MPHTMKRNAQVPRDEWLKFFDQFARGNEGRLVRLEQFGPQFGDENIGKDLPLLSINYDPVSKGNSVTISTGRKEVEYEHTVDSPKEVWVDQDPEGRGHAMEIVSEDGSRTVVAFEQ